MTRNQVFISYSHRDKKWLQRLQTMLKPLEREKLISVWDDTRIRAGQPGREEIERALASAKAAVLLVSPDFLASDFIAQNELPPLLEAAKNEELTILWIAVRPSLYEKTPIKSYQALNNDPNRPLSSLRTADWEKELVEMCGKIESAIAEKEEDQTALSTKDNLGALVSKLCDRADQEKEFTRYFISHLELYPGFPQVYFIPGNEGECHSSLAERLIRTTIKEVAEERRHKKLAGIRHEKIAEWPVAERSALEAGKCALQEEIFKSLHPKHYYRSRDFSAASFGRLSAETLHLHPVVVLEYNIESWNEATPELIKWYLSFWAEVRMITDRPQFVIFLNVIYPSPKPPSSRRARSKQDQIKSKIHQDLHEICDFASQGLDQSPSATSCSCFMLSHLPCVTPQDVRRWARTNNFYRIERDLDEHVRTIFGDATVPFPECRPMIEIEEKLEKIRSSYARERSYL